MGYKLVNLNYFVIMDEKIEKIYCCDRGDNDVLAAMLAGRDSKSDMLPFLAMNGMGNQWNNPFIYLVWMMFAQRMWGNNWNDSGHNAQIAALQNEMQDNHNSDLILQGINGNLSAIRELAGNLNCDFNTLNSAICDVKGGIDRLSGQVGFSAERIINAVNAGNCSVIQALKDCCCATQKSILEMGYQNQLQNCNQTNTIMTGINTVNTGLERGFSQVAYESQKQTCDLINAGNANTQRIIDLLNNHWSAEDKLKIQDLKSEISQLKQTQQLLAAMNNGCGCNLGCGFNQ